MKNDEKKDTLYLCDPQKNTECPKTICQMPNGCFLTTKKEFAKDEKKPINHLLTYRSEGEKGGDENELA